MKDKEEGKDTSSDVEVKYKNIIWETWLSLALFILFLINEFGFLFVNSIDHERSISNMAF